MSEASKVHAIWEDVFGLAYLPENRTVANVMVMSALLTCRSFLSAASKSKRTASTHLVDNNLASYEGWLFDSNLNLAGMVHLSPHDPPSFKRETFVQMLALVVGMARTMLSCYRVHSNPGGRSLRGYMTWLQLDSEEGANEVLVRELALDGCTYLTVLDTDEARAVSDLQAEALSRSKRDHEPGATKVSATPDEEAHEGREVDKVGQEEEKGSGLEDDEVESAIKSTHGAGGSHSNSPPPGAAPVPQLLRTTVPSAGNVQYSYGYEVLLDSVGTGAGDPGTLRHSTNREAGAEGASGVSGVSGAYGGNASNGPESGNSYPERVQGVRLVVRRGEEDLFSCRLTESEGVELCALHERVVQRLSWNMQQVLPHLFGSPRR